MKWIMPTLSAIAIALLLAATHPAHAHHSRAMFDMSHNITLRGVVQEYRWQNPHSLLLVSGSADATSNVETWYVEASSVGVMVNQGWNRTTFKAGDPITVVVHPNRKAGSKVVLLFFAVTTDGKRLYRAEHRYPSEVE